MKNYAISDIEAITEDAAKEMALEVLTIKGHTVYMVDFGGYFGYSCIVFCDGHHIHYANDYQLHHQGKTRDELRGFYIEGLNNKLFTEAELSEPLKSYSEYTQKEYFLRNYYGMRKDYVSAFYIDKRPNINGMIYDPVSFAYYRPEETAFVKHHYELYKALSEQMENVKGNYEYQKSAFLSEMFNHEYGINWQADYDVCSVFCPGALVYHGDEDNELRKYFDQCEFTETQRSAYFDARSEYYQEMGDRL